MTVNGISARRKQRRSWKAEMEKVEAAFTLMGFEDGNRQEFFNLGVRMALKLKPDEMIFTASVPSGDCIYARARSEKAFIDAIKRAAKCRPPMAYHYVVYDGRWVKKEELEAALRKEFGSHLWAARSPHRGRKVLVFRKSVPESRLDSPTVRIKGVLNDDEQYDNGEDASDLILGAKWTKMSVGDFIKSLKTRRWNK
jgi:hypothetical protein